MKKTLFVVLMLLFAGVSGLFAVQIVSKSNSYSDSYSGYRMQSYDYIGMNIGYGVTNETYDLSDTSKRVDKGYQFGFSFNDFMFFDSSSAVGFYVELGIDLNTKTESTINGVSAPEDRLTPFFSDMVVGFAFKAEVDKRTSVLIGVGPEIMVYSKEYKTPKYEKDLLVLGAGIDLEGVYMISKNVYIGVGFRSSFMFYATEIDKKKSSTSYTKYDNYFGYRVLPRFSVYMGI